MRREAFKRWLLGKGYEKATANTRVSNVQSIENYYPDLEKQISSVYEQLLEEFVYGTADERAGIPVRHKVPIAGNQRTGTATFKQALQLYHDFLLEENAIEPVTPFQKLTLDIKGELDRFPLSKKRSYSRDEVKNLIQNPILDLLRDRFKDITWEDEYLLDSANSKRDRADIVGKTKDEDMIVIEIDTYRADQISKKFLSRMALTLHKHVACFAVCYPNNNANAKPGLKESSKYEGYMFDITSMLGNCSGFEKYFHYICLRGM